jgi:hypothetical protein
MSEHEFICPFIGRIVNGGVKPVAPTECLTVTPFSHIVACQMELRERG